MNAVYVLQHTYEDETHEDTKFLGVFSSDEAAKEAILHLRNLPGFRDYPDGFEIDKYEIDRPHWSEGFGLA